MLTAVSDERIDDRATPAEGGAVFPDLIRRACGEFREMPGMQLTSRQATRMWGVDVVTAEWLLGVLVDAGFLMKRGDRYSQASSA